MMPRVSVIIPTYNRGKTLIRAIQSALDQTVAPFEVLVCDDGSTDDSEKKVLALGDARVKWIACGRNGMPAAPRNKGIREAGGEWIAFLDSDDEWRPGKLATQLKALETKRADASCTNAFRISGEKNCGHYLNYTRDRITFTDLLRVNSVVCSSVVVRKKLLEETSLFPEAKQYKAIEDYALWLRLALKTDFLYAPEPLVNYTDDPQSSVRTNYTDVWALRQVIFDGLQVWLAENNISLSQLQRKELDKAIVETGAKGKLSLWQRVKLKIK